MTSHRVVTLAGDPEQEALLSADLTSRADVELVLRCVDRGELLGSIRGGALDGIISVGAPQWLDRQCVEEAAEAAVKLVGLTDDAFQRERLTSLGGLVLPLAATPDDVLNAFLSPSLRLVKLSTQPSRPAGDLIAVWGPKGAPGRSRVAIELAFELARSEPKTLLVDADAYGGDLVQLLGILDELPTVVWAARMAAKEELGAGRLEVELPRTTPAGPLLLPGIWRSELWAEVSDFGWRTLLGVARASFRFTVCDVGFSLEPAASPYQDGEGRNGMARTTVAAANHVVAVCKGDAIGVKNFIWSFEQLADLVDVDDVAVIVNRTQRSEEQEIAQLLRRHIGKRPLVYLPDSPAVVAKAVRAGVPVRELQRGSEMASAMRLLTAAFGGRVESLGLLTRLAGKR